MKKRSNKNAPRVAEEAASADTETDELSALPEELQIRILQDLDEPRDCFNLSLASPRLGLVALRATENGAPKLPAFHDPILAVAMRLTADSDADHERLLRKYAADARVTSEHFAWLEEMSPRLYLASDAGLYPKCWVIREVARVGTVEALVRTRVRGAQLRVQVANE